MKKSLMILSYLSFSLLSGGLGANGPCSISIGGDYLYWQPCVSDLDYAIEANDAFDEADEFKTRYLHPEWDPGVRVWLGVNNIYCGFNAAVVYTYFDTEKNTRFETQVEDSLKLSTSLPFDIDTPDGEVARGEWELEYQSFDLLLSYPLQLTCARNFEFTAFSGIKWLKIDQERHDKLSGNAEEDGPNDGFRINRKLDYWGIGPEFGVTSSYVLCPGFKVFGMFSTALVIGESESKDRFFNIDLAGEDEFDVRFKDNDDCFCFPGFHFASGISYCTCFCNMKIDIHVGWEYIHWINAPSFPYYEKGELGVRSASSEKSLTLQGVFAGANFSF